MTKARTIADLGTGFVNISDTGTEGTKVASGTSAQRGSTTGQWRFNSTLGAFEGRNASEFKIFDTAPTVTGFSASNFESSALPTNITLTGTNFSVGATVHFVDNGGSEIASPSVTRNSATEIVAQIPNTVTSANEPHKVKVTNVSGLTTTSTLEFNIDAAPAFVQNAGSLGNVSDLASGTHFTLTATDDESDSVTFSETTSNLTNAGLTLNSNGTITGAVTDVSSDTTTSFTARASDGTNTTDRNFSITTTLGRNGSSSARSALGGAEILDIAPSSSDGNYYIDPYFSGGQTDVFGNTSDGSHSNPQQKAVDMSGGGWVTCSTDNATSGLTGNGTLPSLSGSSYYVPSVGGNANSYTGYILNGKVLGKQNFPIGYNDWDVQFQLSSTWGFATFYLVSTSIFHRANSSPNTAFGFGASASTSVGVTEADENYFAIYQNAGNNMSNFDYHYWNGSADTTVQDANNSFGHGATFRVLKEASSLKVYTGGSLHQTLDLSSYSNWNVNRKFMIMFSLQGSPSGQNATEINFGNGHIKVKNN